MTTVLVSTQFIAGFSDGLQAAAASAGNEQRCAGMFIANSGHWIRGETLFNVQTLA